MQVANQLVPHAQPCNRCLTRVMCRFLLKAAKEDPPVFICHFYNFYFAHTAGGRMIGSKISSMILDNANLQFYQYDGDYKPYLENVRDSINTIADDWTRESKDHCLEETKNSFSVSANCPLPRFIAADAVHYRTECVLAFWHVAQKDNCYEHDAYAAGQQALPQ